MDIQGIQPFTHHQKRYDYCGLLIRTENITMRKWNTCVIYVLHFILDEMVSSSSTIQNLTLLFQGIVPHLGLLMRVVKKIILFKDHECHMSLNYNRKVIYNFSEPNYLKTKFINVDIVKTVCNLCVYNWESIDGDHSSNV